MSDKQPGLAGTPVKPVINAIRIVRHLAAIGHAARATQIARDLAINPSTCFNILRTLAAEGVLLFDAVAKTYAVGEGLLGLVDRDVAEQRRLVAARPILSQLAHSHRVTATLWRRLGMERIMLVSIEHSPMEMRIDIPLGHRLPALIGATGRLVAVGSRLDKAEIQRLFEALRWARPLSFETYWEEVLLAAERGWAVDEGYLSHGITSVAAPVPDPRGFFDLSLSALAFVGQYQGEEIDRLGADMAMAGRQLSEILYRGTSG